MVMVNVGRTQAMAGIRKARPEEMPCVGAFFRANGYLQPLSPADTVIIAEQDDALCGPVRLCEERGCLVLRGMRVSEGRRRRGIGGESLETAALLIGHTDSCCIAHRQLERLYGRIGCVAATPDNAPAFLHARCAKYENRYGRDVVILRSPGWRRQTESGTARPTCGSGGLPRNSSMDGGQC
jgi:hypothetical protein